MRSGFTEPKILNMNNFYLAFLGIKTYIRKLDTCQPDAGVKNAGSIILKA